MANRTRLELGYLYAGNFGSNLYKAAEDANAVDLMLEYAKTGDEEKFWEKSAEIQRDLKMSNPNAAKTVVRTDNNCWHFEATEGLAALSVDSGMYLPLNKFIVSARGRISAAPDPTFSVAMGNVVWRFDEGRDV